jgi:hypothetical protein
MIRHLGKSSRVDKLPQKMDTDLQQPGLSDARQKHIRARKRVGDFLRWGFSKDMGRRTRSLAA